MAYVTAIYGGSAEQIDYRLGLTQHGCESDVQFRYHADGRERPLRWIGRGLPEFGLDGLTAGAELTAEQHDLARALMAGKHPLTGEQLVAPKLAVPPDAKVPLGPLVAAVQALAAERGLDDPVDVFAKPKQRSAWNTAVRAVARRGDAALLRVDDALALAEAAGLEAEQVWPDVDLLATYSNLYEPQAVVDEDGKPELDEHGQPKIELTPRRVPVGIVGFDIGITLPKSRACCSLSSPTTSSTKSRLATPTRLSARSVGSKAARRTSGAVSTATGTPHARSRRAASLAG